MKQVDPRAFADVDTVTMRELVSASIARPQFYTVLLMLFAGVAIGLAALGLYGVTSYVVARRTPEIGVRMALGASRSRIFGLVFGRGAVQVGAGLILGLGLAVATTRFMQSLLFGVRALDAVTFTTVPIVFCLVAAFALYVPARRATQVDPLVAFRAR